MEDAIFPRDATGAGVRYARLSVDEKISDYAMGEENGIALTTLWLPKWLSEAGLGGKIQLILAGELARLNLSLSEQSLVKVLHDEYFTEKFEESTK